MSTLSSFFKKRNNSESNSGSNKRQRKGESAVAASDLAPNPKRIACWNCNGLSVRLKSASDIEKLKNFLRTFKPDVFFLSEVRLPAAHNAGNRKPSAATTFYRNRIRDSDPKSSNDFAAVNKFLNCEECAHYKAYFSLADKKYAGTAMLINTQTTQLPVTVRFNLQTLDVKRTVHDTDGRVIFAKFPDFSILHTYVPNNGWGEDHFKRRQAWDEAIKSFMKRKKDAGVKLMWIGDLNVAPLDLDLSHPSYFRIQVRGGTRRRTGDDGGGSGSGGTQSDDDDDDGDGDGDGENGFDDENIGQPGCTDGERRRFWEILETGDLWDAFRKQNVDVDNVFSWRGNRTGMMTGRGMRIDHCIASRSLMPSLREIKVISGDESDDWSGFMGSDHCPVYIVCSDKDEHQDYSEKTEKKDVVEETNETESATIEQNQSQSKEAELSKENEKNNNCQTEKSSVDLDEAANERI